MSSCPQIIMKEVMLVLILVVWASGQLLDYYCGDVVINRDADCVCENKTITYSDFKGCYGHIHCVIESDGSGSCAGGDVGSGSFKKIS